MSRDRADSRWQYLEEPWQRLQWARETAGYRTAAAFARAAHMEQHTYRAYERSKAEGQKATALDFAKARAWAPLLRVRWEWLLDGDGVPWDDESAVAEISRLVAGESPAEQERVLEMVRLMLNKRAS